MYVRQETKLYQQPGWWPYCRIFARRTPGTHRLFLIWKYSLMQPYQSRSPVQIARSDSNKVFLLHNPPIDQLSIAATFSCLRDRHYIYKFHCSGRVARIMCSLDQQWPDCIYKLLRWFHQEFIWISLYKCGWRFHCTFVAGISNKDPQEKENFQCTQEAEGLPVIISSTEQQPLIRTIVGGKGAPH